MYQLCVLVSTHYPCFEIPTLTYYSKPKISNNNRHRRSKYILTNLSILYIFYIDSKNRWWKKSKLEGFSLLENHHT